MTGSGGGRAVVGSGMEQGGMEGEALDGGEQRAEAAGRSGTGAAGVCTPPASPPLQARPDPTPPPIKLPRSPAARSLQLSSGDGSASGGSAELSGTAGSVSSLFSPPVLRASRGRAQPWAADDVGPASGSSPVGETCDGLPPSRDVSRAGVRPGRIRLSYDSILDCYFDPVTSKYYEILQ